MYKKLINLRVLLEQRSSEEVEGDDSEEQGHRHKDRKRFANGHYRHVVLLQDLKGSKEDLLENQGNNLAGDE
jgi:hypothetical protein